MVNYYTLEEAARLLGTSPDELRKMADRGEIRAFRDRGNLRFRNQDIDERARQLGRGSDPGLQPGDAIRPRGSDTPSSHRRSKLEQSELEMGDEGDVDLGNLSRAEQPSSKRRGTRSSGKIGPTSPPPKSGSDSDVRLVAEGSDVDFRMVNEPPPPSSRRITKKKPDAKTEDSGVRIVPLDSDSDVRVMPDRTDEGTVVIGPGGKSGSDSDIRLQQEPSSHRRPGSSKRIGKAEPPVTEEIDLDAELREAGTGSSRNRPRRSGLKQQPALPTSSPFELSDPNLPGAKQTASAKGGVSDSSDFDLTPSGKDDSSPLELDSDEEVALGGLTERGSGINLQDPADSGISLEKGGSGEDIEMELSLDAGATPKPAPGQPIDSSDEFELAPSSSQKGMKSNVEQDSDSEFELSMDSGASSKGLAEVDSDSEFELTLDDSGGLAPLEEGGSGEHDIFDTDFEVPALDEDSGDAAALSESDTDMEGEDFALEEGDATAEEESHSQVVAIDEDRPRRRRRDLEEEEETEEEAERPGRLVAAAPADWGVMPALVMVPCVIVMILAGLMSFELVQSMWGYHQPGAASGLIVRPLSQWLGDQIAK